MAKVSYILINEILEKWKNEIIKTETEWKKLKFIITTPHMNRDLFGISKIF
jgi:hypothetical protein